MTNGCFDVLHPGHVASLQEARRHGDLLVVGRKQLWAPPFSNSYARPSCVNVTCASEL